MNNATNKLIVYFPDNNPDQDGSIDLTGYNERLIQTPTDASDPSWSGLLSGK